jgi:homoserine kinase type II
MSLKERYAAILAAWQLGVPDALVQPASGTINTIVRATIAGRDYYLRQYRHPERAPREHAIIAHLHARDFPVVAPLPLPGGATFLDHDGERYALYPAAPGRQRAREHLTPSLLAAMGRHLAVLHHALHDLVSGDIPRRIITGDRDATLAALARLQTMIGQRDGTDPLDQIAVARLAARRAWLETHSPSIAPDPAILAEQAIHGDYQETNLFFDGGAVCAVIDWDNSYLASRAWEIARVLDYVCEFTPARSRLFLDGYRSRQSLSLAELDRAIAAYGSMRAHDLWLYSEYFLRGNERVGRFITPGGFVPIADRWTGLRPHLTDRSGAKLRH